MASSQEVSCELFSAFEEFARQMRAAIHEEVAKFFAAQNVAVPDTHLHPVAVQDAQLHHDEIAKPVVAVPCTQIHCTDKSISGYHSTASSRSTPSQDVVMATTEDTLDSAPDAHHHEIIAKPLLYGTTTTGFGKPALGYTSVAPPPIHCVDESVPGYNTAAPLQIHRCAAPSPSNTEETVVVVSDEQICIDLAPPCSTSSGNPSVAATLTSVDCFVKGCDALVLLDETGMNEMEKDAPPHLTRRSFSFMDRVKAFVEEERLGIVFRTDTLSLTVRDAVGVIDGPSKLVLMGKRDETVSIKQEALNRALAPTMNFIELLQSCQNKDLDPSYYGFTDADLRELCLGVWRIDVWSIASFPAVGIGTGPCIGSATACEGAPTMCSMEFLNSVPALVYMATIEDFIFDPGITVEVSSTSSAVPIDNSSGMSTKCSMNDVAQPHVFKSMENKCRKTPWPPPPQKLTNQKASLKLIVLLFHWTLKYFCEIWDFWKYMAMLWSTSHGSQVCCCITSRAINGALIPIISGHHDSYISTGSETISVWFGDQEPSKGNQLGIYRRSKLIMCSAFDVLSELLLPFVPVLSDVLVEGTPPSISWYCIDLEQ